MAVVEGLKQVNVWTEVKQKKNAFSKIKRIVNHSSCLESHDCDMIVCFLALLLFGIFKNVNLT